MKKTYVFAGIFFSLLVSLLAFSGHFKAYSLSYLALNSSSTSSCVDTVNGFEGTDGNCYCNDGYEWNSSAYACTKQVLTCGSLQYLGSDDMCYCKDGYFREESGKCVTETRWCRDNYGDHISYDKKTDTCLCDNGYAFSETKNSCIAVNKVCQELNGKNSYSDKTRDADGAYNCFCKEGYFFDFTAMTCAEGTGVSTDDTGAQKINTQIPTNDQDSTSVVLDNPFTDIGSHKNKNAILYLKNKRIIDGNPDASFRPDNTLSRAELAKIIVVGAGVTPTVEQYHDCFSDVGKEWFAPYVCYTKEQGWVVGYSDGTFRPNHIVSKVEAIKVLLGSRGVTLDLPGNIAQNPFVDVDKAAWYGPYVSKAKDLGLLEETGDTFSGDDGMTRGGMSENLYRLLLSLDEREAFINASLEAGCEMFNDDGSVKDFVEVEAKMKEIFKKYNFDVENDAAMQVLADKYQKDEDVLKRVQDGITKCAANR